MSHAPETLIRCPACDGYGWLDGDGDEDPAECDWCAGSGYVWRSAQGADRAIAPAEYGQVAERLEALERERLREMGYSGDAKKPWEQAIRIERNDGLTQRGGAGADEDSGD
jgi:hypothetical protein